MEPLIVTKRFNNTKKSAGAFQIVLFLVVFILSVIAIVTGVFSAVKSSIYSLLFLPPLVFLICCVFSRDLISNIPQNLGATLIFLFIFVRNVISPILLFLGDFTVTITEGIETNTGPAILLVSYETIALFAAMNMTLKKRLKIKLAANTDVTKKYVFIVAILVGLLIIFNIITPQLLGSYRTIFQIRDQWFTNFEDSDVTAKYGTTFLTKFSLVTGQYLVRVLMVLFPGTIIAILSVHKNTATKFLSVLLCFTPLLLIGGAIARSFIDVVILFLFYNQAFRIKNYMKKSVLLLAVASLFVVVWWIFYSNKGVFDFHSLSAKFSAYFSGINVVSGAFNLPNDISMKFRYFIYDFTTTIPYGNTIFHISHETVQPFFNFYNNSFGQIPPTIGMSYYYFGPIFAPVYSCVFAYIAVQCSKKLNINGKINIMSRLRLLLMIFDFSMGIIMYNIEITMTNVFTLYLPLLIIEKLSDSKKRKK